MIEGSGFVTLTNGSGSATLDFSMLISGTLKWSAVVENKLIFIRNA